MSYLLRLYELLPVGVVAIALLMAGGSWVVNYHWQRQYERMPLYPPMSLGVAAGFVSLGLFYLWLSITPGLPSEVRAGGVRVLLLVLSGATVVYNGGMITRSIGKFVKARKRE